MYVCLQVYTHVGMRVQTYIYIYMSDEVYFVISYRTRILTAGPDLVPQVGLDSGCMSEIWGSGSNICCTYLHAIRV